MHARGAKTWWRCNGEPLSKLVLQIESNNGKQNINKESTPNTVPTWAHG